MPDNATPRNRLTTVARKGWGEGRWSRRVIAGVAALAVTLTLAPFAPAQAVPEPPGPEASPQTDGAGRQSQQSESPTQDGPQSTSGSVAMTEGIPGDFSDLGAAGDGDRARDDQRGGAGERGGFSTEPRGVAEDVRAEAADGGDVAVIIRLRQQVGAEQLRKQARSAGIEAVRAEAARLQQRDLRRSQEQARLSETAQDARASAVVSVLRSTAKQHRGDVARLLRSQASNGHAGDVTPYWIFNGFAATVDRTALDKLADHPDVASVTLDEKLRLPKTRLEDKPKLPTWGLERVRAPRTWGEYGERGEGVVVGVMDSGADGDHPAIADAWRGQDGDPAKSWFDPTRNDYATPQDGFGHGTHVTGTIVGGPPGDVIGVAPGAEWIAAKIFNDFGGTSDSIIHAGFQWMLAPGGDPAAAPDIVNNSWGSPATYDTEFWDDVNAWVSAGIVPIFANGNDGPALETVGSPGSFPQSIGVGATDFNDVVAGFSSRGGVTWDGVEMTKPQVSAPGHHIYSAWPQQLSETGYETISGTSMAAPHATGVAALMLGSAPGLSVEESRALLENTARVEPHMGALPDNDYGHGVVNAYAAVTKAASSGTVTGTVTGPDGPVQATISVAGVEWAETTSTEAGDYVLSVPDGRHVLRVTAPGYAPAKVTVDIVAGETYVEDVTLEPATTYTVSGTVTGPSGALAGARVSVEADGVDPAFTGSDGGFAVDVPEGTHDVQIVANGFVPWRGEVTVDGNLTLDRELEPLDTASAAGWSQFQNNAARTGLSAEAVSAESLRQAWQVDVGTDVTFSSPVVSGGRAFVNTDGGRLVALDLGTGETLWTHQTSELLRGAPAVADGRVFVGGGVDGGVSALDAETGETVWHHETPGRLTVYTAPTVVDGTVYAATGPTADGTDTVYALDAVTGDVRWQRDVGPSVFAGPAVADGHLVVASADDATMTALDPATGAVQWTLDRSDQGDYFVGGPSIADGVVYATTTHTNGWDGSMLAIDAATGEVVWEDSTHGDGQGTTPAVYGDVVIAGSHSNGSMVAYDRASGEVRWRHSNSGPISSSPLVSSDGFVIAGSQLDRQVFAVDAATGRTVWSDVMPSSVTSSAAYADGTLLTADTSGAVRAYTSTGTVRGVVTGPDGPLEATVELVGTGRSVTSDPETGAYRIDHKPGSYELRASAYGLGQQTESMDIVAGRVTTVDLQLTPVGSGTLTGHVVDEAGEPLEGATVTVLGTPLEPASTDDAGDFTFPDVAAGTYTVRVELPGYQTAEVSATVEAGATSTVEATLLRYQVAVIGDYEGRMVAELTEHGYRAQASTYDGVTQSPGAYEVVVANGADDDPGAAALRAFIDATDAAGTSVVWLDQWSIGYGSISHLSRNLGDPAEIVDSYSSSGRVGLIARAEHPLTEGLAQDELTEILVPGHEWSAFTGYSGRSVADVSTDEEGVVGSGLAYKPRGTGSVHVLLSNLAAAPWGDPQTEWTDAGHQVLDNAVGYAMDATFGDVSGTVTGPDGPLAATVTVTATGETTTASADGSYSLLLPPGEHTLRFSHRGMVAVERTVEVVGGATTTVDVALVEAGRGAVAGTVTDGAGDPVAGAQVSLDGTEHTATTAADGSYTIADVPARTYTLRVGADGFLTATREVTVTSDSTTTADVTLSRAARVGVVGDDDGLVTALLTERELVAEEIAWSDVGRVGEFDVIAFVSPDDPGAETFRAWMQAMDQAQVSGVFGAGYFDFNSSVELLREYEGNPSEVVGISDEGRTAFHEVVEEHPIFDGVEPDPTVLRPDRYAAAIKGYTGFTVADLVTDQGNRGAGVAYQPRSAGSVHVLLGGLTSGLLKDADEDWTPQGAQVYTNAVSWAAAPGLGTVQGTVTGQAGAPVDGSVSVLGTRQEAQLDDEGGYALNLPPGDFTLRISAYGYAAQEHEVSVTEGGVATLDAELAPVDGATSVSGVVTSDGGPVADATVRLLDHPRSATTGADGTYELGLVEPGDYTLEVVAADHVRYRAALTVTAGEALVHDVDLQPTARVGVIDDDGDTMKDYLTYWGYQPEDLEWTDTDRVADLDLVIANMASYSGSDPGAEGLAAFDQAAVEAGISVVWLDQFGRGSFRYLSEYTGDPGVDGQGRDDGPVVATVTAGDHPVFDGLPDTFEVVEPDNEYSWFDDFGGDVLATVSTDETTDRGLVGVRPRGTHAVDLLVGTLSVGYYGTPGYGGQPADAWTPEGERLLRNAVAYALAPGATGALVEGTLQSASGEALAGTVSVEETGRSVDVGTDGAYSLALAPGTWTLRGEAFGHAPGEVTVTVEAGQSVTQDLVLDTEPVGTVAGTVTGPDGAPVAGAEVALVDTPLTATTGADGTFTLTDVPVGTWGVEVSAAGFQNGRSEVEVTEGGTATVDMTLETSRQVAVVEDYRSSLTGLLEGEGYTVTGLEESDLETLAGSVGDYDVVIFNDSVYGSEQDFVLPVLAAAADAGVSVLFGGQWGGDAIGTLSDLRGDPEGVDYSSVPAPIAYTPSAEHPIFAGFETGTPIELMRNPDSGGNQQWLSYLGYSGTTIAQVTETGSGADLGAAVGYQFTSPSSVEVLLGSLTAGGYGYPGERWTADAERIYLNAVGWAAEASQGSVSGVVTSAGEPVADASVSVVGSERATTTGADGGYSLGLVDGTHTLRFAADGFEPVERTVTVEDSSAVTLDVELTALPRSSIEGTVTDTDGNPVAGAEVSATGPSDWTVTTDAEGAFVKQDLLEGEYTLQVRADGYLPAEATATVTAGAPTVVDIELEPLRVAVLGDHDTGVQQLLRANDVAAGAIGWSDDPDFARYDVVVVNGAGDADVDQQMFDAMVDEADAEETSVVYTGTWGVDRGGVRLLEEFSDRVTVAAQGYGEGPVRLTGFDAGQPLFAGLEDPATLVAEGGYYSTLAEYAGAPLADLSVAREDRDPVTGLSAAYSWRTAGSIELVLSASAVTGTQGPDLGWTEAGERLLLNAVAWARDVEQAPPGAPTLEAAETLTTADSVTVTGTAKWPSTVSVRRDGTEVASATTALDGGWSAEVPLVEGDNVLTAVATNYAGSSPPSPSVTVVRDTTGPQVDWRAPGDLTGSFEPEVEISGVVTDAHAGVAELRLGDTDVKVAEDGGFSVTAPLVEGENVLTLTAVDVLGNETVVSRTVLHRDWTPRWRTPGRSGLVQLWLDGAPTDSPPAEQATLVVTDADGDEVGRHALRWTDDHYQVRPDRRPRRSDTLTGVLVVDGFAFTTQAPPGRLR